MLNHITVMGRLTRDPELRRTGSGTAVTNFCLAVERDYSPKDGAEKETDFIDCVAWRGTGEFVAKHFSKGRMAVASGRLQIRTWTDKDGNNRRSAEVVADSVYFGDSKKSADDSLARPLTASELNSLQGLPSSDFNSPQVDSGPYAETLAYAKQLQAQGMQTDFAMLDDDTTLPF